jgi:class 3 adenylate cyclase/tetratricopeptide (TPR) repeat protein
MHCPACQLVNPAGSTFCLECGAKLALTCPACTTDLPPDSKFCNKCGARLVGRAEAQPRFASPGSYTPKHLAEKILTSKAALEGERKQVTVLFADMKGSMELLADRDPEVARKLLDPVLERMMEAVHRYEGTVNQVMGDGIMALFGAPLAHEDHAVRACYAALRMQESVGQYAEAARHAQGPNVQIRIGINSGEVVVRAIGSDLRMDYTAVGETTHLAGRMEQLASPGRILLTGSTLKLVEGYFAVTALGPVPVKGLIDAVDVYELTGEAARTRFEAATRRGLTRFVGRDPELEHLRRVQELAASGHGQIAAIIGEAGVGKSRLVYEFTHFHRSPGWLVLEGASLSYGKAMSYLPMIDLLKGYFKVQDQDDAREIREKITAMLMALDRSLAPALPALLGLLDVPLDDAAWRTLDPAERRRQTFAAVHQLLLREAHRQPLLLIFEDLHWMDGETQALIDGLVDRLESARVLMLVNYRPEYQHPWGSKSYYSQMRLGALPAESAGELLDALLGHDPGLAPLKQLLVKRGNPFFLEETVRTLVETKALTGERGAYRLTQPVHAIEVPPTVQAMLAARIDRLVPEDKRLLQVASVVGKKVPFALLKAVADLPDDVLRRRLTQLQAAEFLIETGLFPDVEYTFKHTLTHEVTYSGLLHYRRRELHARIVDAIETLYRDRLGGEIERLAHHALRGKLQEKAVRYLRQAGVKASGQSALADAQVWFEQALDVLAVLPESQHTLEQGFEIRLELRPVLNQLGEGRRLLERLREAEVLAERLNDGRRRGQVCAIATNTHALLGELDEALVTGARALEIAGRLEDLRLRILTTSYLEVTHYYRGDYEHAVELATDNLAALPADWVYEHLGAAAPPSVLDRVWLVMSLAELGRFGEAAEYQAEAIRIAEPTQHAYTVGQAYRAAGTLHLLQGDWANAWAQVEHGIALARAGNVVLLLPWALASSAWAFAYLGRASESLDRLRESEQLLEGQAGRGIVAFRTWAYHALGRASLVLGRLDEARRLGERALECSPGHQGFMAHARHLLGDIATHPDRFDPQGGEGHYREALALAQPRGMRPLVAHCHFGLGKLYRRFGKREQAHEHLTTATTMYREMDMRFWLEQAEAAMHEASG